MATTIKERTGTIEWYEDKHGTGQLKLRWEDGREELAEFPEPISASTDSDEVAGQFGHDYLFVEHDRDVVHVGANPPEYDEPTWPCGITQEGAERLQVQYARAVEGGAETLSIDGREISTEYAKHLLEYLDASAARGGVKSEAYLQNETN